MRVLEEKAKANDGEKLSNAKTSVGEGRAEFWGWWHELLHRLVIEPLIECAMEMGFERQ